MKLMATYSTLTNNENQEEATRHIKQNNSCYMKKNKYCQLIGNYFHTGMLLMTIITYSTAHHDHGICPREANKIRQCNGSSRATS